MKNSITNSSIKLENQNVDYYFKKFQMKMGKDTTLGTALGWTKSAILTEKGRVKLQNKIKKYINNKS